VVVEAGDVVELLARELKGVLVGGGVLVYQGLAVGELSSSRRGSYFFPAAGKSKQKEPPLCIFC